MTTTETQPAVTRIHVEGYRSLRDVTLEPGRVTVLIGPNGSGKSNLLSFLQLLSHVRAGLLQVFVQRHGGASALLHYGPKVTPVARFRLDLESEGHKTTYAAELQPSAGDGLTLLSERVALGTGDPETFTERIVSTAAPESRLRDGVTSEQDPASREILGWLSRLAFCHFHDTSHSSPLRQNARQAEDRVLRPDGANLASFLLRMKTSTAPADVVAWRRIGLLVPRVAPSIGSLDPEFVNPATPESSAVRLLWTDRRGHRFDTHDLSDGTLRAIALIAVLAQPTADLPSLICIDEPELGLHPAAITILAALIRSVSVRCQVILATQSPALLDEFEANHVVVCEQPDGDTTLRRLDVQALAAWLEDYSLSELYEKNLLGGQP